MQAWQIAPNQDIWGVMSTLAGIGYTMTVQASPSAGTVQYQVVLSTANFPQQMAKPGDWIVWDAVTATVYTTAQVTAQFAQGS